jgi:oxygen-dependent protoporphyrinogen oxidase
MSEESSAQVVVVGAGIAGLTAAHFLDRAGVRVKVLEASSRVGGRMITDSLNGHSVDCGAQFLSSEYSLLRALLKDAGLDASLRRTTPWNAIVCRGKLCRICSSNPLSALASGLLGPVTWMKLGWQLARLRSSLASLPLNDYSRWTAFDTETVAAWANRALGSSALEYIFEPMLEGFFFQRPEDSSLALGLMLLSFGARNSRTLALADGLGSLPEALAVGLDVAIKAPLRSLSVGADSALVTTDSERIKAAHVILAIPAHHARPLYDSAEPSANRLMAVPYSATINIAVVADQNFCLPHQLRKVYGLLIPRRERRHIAAICIEANKFNSSAQNGQLFNILLSSSAAMAMMELPDEAIVAAALREAESYLPGLTAQTIATRLYRWRHAEPWSRVGKAWDIAEYRANPPLDRRVWLAGDYTSMPFTEGAVESGKWAADAICQRIMGNPAVL